MQITKFFGLNLQDNSFETEGFLEKAENILISRDNIIQKRNGYQTFIDGLMYGSHTVLSYLKNLILLSPTSVTVVEQASDGSFLKNSEIKTRVALDIQTSRYCQAAGNLYIPSKKGLLKIESINENIIFAGVEKAPDLDYIGSEPEPNSGIHNPDTQIGYRIVFGRKDANQLVVLGAPSEIVTRGNMLQSPKSIKIKNHEITITATEPLPKALKIDDFVTVKYSNGVTPIPDGEYVITAVNATNNEFTFSTTAVLTTPSTGVTTVKFGFRAEPKLQATIPKNCLYTDYFYRIYRTNASINNEVEPDESTLQLVIEKNITKPEIESGFITYTDKINDLFRVGFLYTNPNTGQGILESNMPPPVCEDVAFFKEHMFLTCPTTINSTEIDLIKANGDLLSGDSFIVETGNIKRTYTAANSDEYSTTDGGKFKIFTSSNSVAVNIDNTARSICRVINRDKNGTIYASYVSSSQSLPGKMYFYSRIASVKFSLRASTKKIAACFNPSLPVAATDKSVDSISDTIPNGVYISKFGEIEAFPLTSYINVGAKQAKILRIVPLKNSLIILKEDGVFRLSGSSRADFSVFPLDLTIICNAPESVVELDGSIYACTFAGIVRITETEVSIVSRNIEPLLTAIFSQPDFSAVTFATTVPTERLYMLTTYTPNARSFVTYVYNVLTNVWTTSSILYRSGVVNPTDNLHYAINNKNKLIKMRRNNNKTDFCDESTPVISATPVDATCKCWLINSQLKIEVGDIIATGDVINRVIAVKPQKKLTECHFSRKANIDNKSEHFKSITSEIISSPIGLDENVLKQFSEFQASYRNNSCSKLELAFISDASDSSYREWQARGNQSGWGNSPWGFFTWGLGETIDIQYQTYLAEPTRVFVPLQNQMTTWLKVKLRHSQAAEQINIQSLAFAVRNISNRTSK
ncbi:hypothetical protein [Fluviispira vulneris]|uniref:hypothetical protein n=1 Tax=Fluviispira vulneris TaxID=2763012 RepID=UPI0016485EE3|nr:hypothetical protein [Fluviispira vulneris]